MTEDAQPFGKKARIALVIVLWIPVAFLIWGFFQWSWWFGAAMAVGAVWFTWDYLERGDLISEIEEGLSRGGRMFGEGASEVLKRDDD